MLKRISKDEWYPVYYLDDSNDTWGTNVEVPEELICRHDAVNAEFELVQQELEKLFAEAKND